ncbi:hypothetical protein [Pseudovibrio ascidiaceicola]|uniref:hypothetical protein n=1 Tax=Pseudovibrio ascidiaceicola TaxID=285279 RepID=UPI001AD91F2A|nr:hypothetical protein [Pseudovibrio ascidiaceicola]
MVNGKCDCGKASFQVEEVRDTVQSAIAAIAANAGAQVVTFGPRCTLPTKT